MLNPTTRRHFDFSALDSIFVREAFAREESGTWRVYAGVQNGSWEFDEIRWWDERRGARRVEVPEGITPPRVVASELFLQTATLDTIAMDARGDNNLDPLLRVASSANLIAQASANYSSSSTKDYQVTKPYLWQLYSATTGELVAEAGVSGVLGPVPNGSYVLWAKCQTSYPDWGAYDGEWSAIKVRVGSGNWTWNTGIYPGPGSPLYSKIGTGELVIGDTNALDFVHAFDPLARIVSASCVVHTDIRTANGQIDIPAGSQLIAGVRASRGGPQTAVWLLRENHTARLICADRTYSDGACECAKTNHFTSDTVQGLDGNLYVLSECDLAVYNPDASDVFSRFQEFPLETYGQPGGQSLRFANDGLSFWSENLPQRAVVTGDGRNFYNQQVYRVGNTNFGGIGSRWHGTNCAEVFRGKLFSTRQDKSEEDEEATQTIDSITSGRWDRDSVLSQSGYDRTWQRLRRCGEDLYLFGYKTLGEVDYPTLHIAHETSFAEAKFDFFIRKATECRYDGGDERLLVAARASADGIGITNQVIEFIDMSSKLCSFWNEGLGGFVFDLSQFEALGGDADKLPSYLKWKPQIGSNAGGVWVATATIPVSGEYLTLSVVEDEIRYIGTLPYDPDFWGVLCMFIDSNGDVTFEINPSCTNAKCVFDELPAGTKWRHLRLEVPSVLDPLWTLQISDVNEDRKLQFERDNYPILWLRTDSNQPFENLSSYTQLAAFGREIYLKQPASKWLDAAVIFRGDGVGGNEVLPVEAPVVTRRS